MQTAMQFVEKTPYLMSDYLRDAGVEGRFAWARRLKMPFKPYQHQITGLNGALRGDRFGLFDEPALGKSLVAQAYGVYYAAHGNKVIYVMPPSLCQQFEGTCRKNFEGIERLGIECHALIETKKRRERLTDYWTEEEGWPALLIVSYERFRDDYEMYMDAGYRLIVCDEAHKLKDPESRQSKAVHYFLRQDGGDTAGLFMTGTPIPNTLEDAYGMLKLVNPTSYASKNDFEKAHMIYEMRGAKPARGMTWAERKRLKRWRALVGFKDTTKLHKALYLNAQRTLKNDVLDLSKPLISEVLVNITKSHKGLYDKLVKEKMLELEDEIITAQTASSMRMKCLKIATNPLRFVDRTPKGKPTRDIKNAVVEMIDEKLDEIGSKEKCVLVCHFRDTVEMLDAHYQRKGYGTALLYGGTNGPIQKQIDAFVNDESCRLAIIHPESGGVGVDGFQQVCKYMIFVEPTSVPGQFIQTVDRLVRPGQRHVVTVWILKIVGTISPKMTRNMVRKAGDTQQVMQDKGSLLSELLDQ